MSRGLYVLLSTCMCYMWIECPAVVMSLTKQEQINQLKDEVAVLTNELDDLKNVSAAQSEIIDIVLTVNTEQNQRLENITTQLEQLMNSKAGQVAFTAYMTVGHFYSSAGDVIPFNSALLNIGSHYDTSSSVFTCPRKGVYFFAFSIFTSCLDYISNETSYERTGVELMLDDQIITKAESRNMDSDCMTVQMAGSVVVECLAGGEVWLEAGSSTNRMTGYSAAPRTVFSGFVLHYL